MSVRWHELAEMELCLRQTRNPKNGHDDYPHVESNAQGDVLVSGTRYKAGFLAGEHYQYGWTADELLRQHPDLRPEQVYSVLTWFYDNPASVVAKLTDSLERTSHHGNAVSLSRAGLLSRVSNETNQS